MAYRILVDGELIFDPVEDNSVVSSASISQSINAAAYLDFTVSPECVLPINEGESQVEVRWDSQTLFYGRVTDVSEDTEGWKDVSCVSDVDLLNNVLVRPYSSDGSSGNKAPTTMAEYFSWLVQQYNQGGVGGKRIDIDVNQGNQIVDGEVSFSSSDYPSVANELENNILSYGGYLDYIPYANGGTLNLYSDLHDVNAQIIDFGENITSITIKRDSSSQHNAIIPHGKNADNEDIDLSSASEQELKLVTNAGYMINGDAFYSPDYTDKYGYREIRYDVGTVENVSEMIRYAIAHLRTLLAPQLTIECKAVDMALYNDNYQHLRTGQAARVRAEVRGVDEYLTVNDMQLDLTDPAQTTYTFGISYDTLTGNQSALLSKLNGEINGALDKVQDVVDGIGNVVNDVDVEYYISNSPDEPLGGEWGVGNITEVDNKYVFSRLKKEQADGTIVISDPTLLTPSVQRSLKLHRDVGDSPVWVAFIAANVDVTDNQDVGMVRVSGQMGGWDASEQGAVTVAFGLQDADYGSDSGGKAGVGVVTEKSSDIDTSKVDIQSYVDNGRVGIYVMLTGKVTISLYADGGGFSTPFVELTSEPSGTRVFSLADTQTTYESAILQADNAIRAYVKATYATQGQLGEVESAFDIRANQIEASVSEKMDTTVANQTFVNQSTFDQFSDSITTTVEQTVQTADEAYTKASQVEQTVDGIEVTLTETVEKADEALATAQSVNLIYNSNFSFGSDNWVGDTGTLAVAADSDYRYHLEVKMSGGLMRIYSNVENVWVSGRTYAYSFYARASSSGATVQPSRSLADYGQTHTLTTSWARYSGVISCTQTAPAGTLSFTFGSTSPTYYLANVKLEVGATATSWSQSPLDAQRAARTATNYLKFDSSGLCVGNMTGTLGYNALITSSQYQIRNGSTVLSSFGASQVDLGQNSTGAQINLCGGRGSLYYNGSFNLDTSAALGIYSTAGNIVMNGNAGITLQTGGNSQQINLSSYKLKLGYNGTAIRGVYAGFKTITTSGSDPLLFTPSQYSAIVGRAYKSGDQILLMNGNATANNTPLCAAFYVPATGNIGARMASNSSGSYQVGYLIVAVV